MAIYGLYSQKNEFSKQKLTVLDYTLEAMMGMDAAEIVADVDFIPDDRWYQRDAIGSQGDHAHFKLLDGHSVARFLPDLTILHSELLSIVNHITSTELIPSPYIRSAVNVRKYEEGDSEGRHYDTQDIACVLFLTHGSPLVVEIDGELVSVDCVPDRLVVFEGKSLLHHVPTQQTPEPRLSVPLN